MTMSLLISTLSKGTSDAMGGWFHVYLRGPTSSPQPISLTIHHLVLHVTMLTWNVSGMDSVVAGGAKAMTVMVPADKVDDDSAAAAALPIVRSQAGSKFYFLFTVVVVVLCVCLCLFITRSL